MAFFENLKCAIYSLLYFLLECSSLILLIFGIFHIKASSTGVEIRSPSYEGLVITSAVIGLIDSFVGFFSITLKKSYLLVTSWIIIAVVSGLNATIFTIGIITEVYSDEYYKNITIFLENPKLLDDAQKELKCCGISGPEYYTNGYPATCCKSGTTPCVQPYYYGCADVIMRNLKGIGYTAGAAMIVGIVYIIYSGKVKFPWSIQEESEPEAVIPSHDYTSNKHCKEESERLHDVKRRRKLERKLRAIVKKMMELFNK